MAERSFGPDVPKEGITGAVPTILSDHEAIHKKWGFSASVFASIANGASIYLELIVPASGPAVHLKSWLGWGEGGVNHIEVVESPTLTTGVTAIVPQNRNRIGSPPASIVTVKSNPTAISGGTVVDGPRGFGGGGVGSGSGGNANPDQELDLKYGSTTLIRATNLSGAAKNMSLFAFWYEEPVS